MTREMYVSSTPHETKVALVEDDQLAEIFYERENEYTLAGSIYKGRVTRVLPGMQSAFVDIGLERDAFLYVSDFLEISDDEESEFDEIAVTRPETFVTNQPPQEPRFEFKPEAAATDQALEDEAVQGNTQEFAEVLPSAESREEGQERFRGGRRRRRGRRGRGFPESKFSRPNEQAEETSEEAEAPVEDFGPPAGYQPIVLPGESLSKYRDRAPEPEPPLAEPEPAAEEAQSEQEAPVESAVAEREPVQQPRPAEPRRYQPYQRILLPGESISKYKQAPAEAAVPVEPSEPVAEPEAQAEATQSEISTAPVEDEAAAPAESADVQPAQSEEAQSEAAQSEEAQPEEVPSQEPVLPPPAPEPRQYKARTPILLPGESIAKYTQRETAPEEKSEEQSEETPAATVTPEPPAADEPATEASETFRPQPPRYERRSRNGAPSDGTFTVLPGESISKYRKDAPTEQMAQEQAEHAAESAERHSEQAATFVIESEPWTETLTRDLEQSATVTEAPVVAEEEAESAPEEEEIQLAPEALGESPDLVEEIAEAEQAVLEAADEQDDEIEGEAADLEGDQQYGDARQGTLEHEEIEGDEEESHLHFAADEEADADYIEMEEETLDAERFTQIVAEAAVNVDLPHAEHLAEAVEESDTDRPSLGGAYEVEEHGEVDEDTEFVEEELEHEPAFPEEQQEEAIGHAEARSAGQRHERQPFDRRRGRRGGGGGGRGGRIMRRREAPRQQVPISELLKEGQEVLVQIAKEPIGKKGARITSHIALPGRFLVYMPTITHIGVSRKITSDEERQRLKRIMISEREGGHGGFIVRTAAAGVGEDELRADIRFLKNLWAQIKQRAESGKAPALIYHDLNLVERILRDQVTSDFAQIWVDNEVEYERILNFANRFQPGLVRRVKLYTKDTPLYEQFGIQDEINKSLKAKVWLKSGGYIVINQTEALVAIDINTGKYVGKTARLEDTIVKTNIDATKEIVRQIRLRDLGGIIVVDFIDMDERRNRQKVMQALEEALRADRSPSKVLAFNDFGLVAITRKRVKQSLERTLGAPCPYCTGNGYVKSVTTVCNEIYVELRKMARHFENDIVHLRVNPEIAKALKAEKGKWLQDFEEISGRPVLIKPDPLLHQEQFDIES